MHRMLFGCKIVAKLELTQRNILRISQHGKSTLCDKILRDCSVEVSEDRMMDSGDLERERGITITSKVTTVEYKDYLLNIVDSPGHSEYEQITPFLAIKLSFKLHANLFHYSSALVAR